MVIYCVGAPFSGKSKSKFARYFSMKLLGTGEMLRTIAKLTGPTQLDVDELTNAIVLTLAILRHDKPDLSMVSEDEIRKISEIQKIDSRIQRDSIALALQIKERMSKLELLPDQWVVDLFNAKLDLQREGVIVDGIPRNAIQAASVKHPDRIIFYTLEREKLYSRANQRAAQEPDRPDNDPSKYTMRLEEWFQVEEPILDYYRQMQIPIIVINSNGSYCWGVVKTIWALMAI